MSKAKEDQKKVILPSQSKIWTSRTINI